MAMRRSCTFCRRRKIRCSGESNGCSACTTRKQVCLFEASSVMGRPRSNPIVQKSAAIPKQKKLDSRNDVLHGMEKLRLSSDIRETFGLFKDEKLATLLSSFLGLATKNFEGSESAPDIDSEVKDGSNCRAFYESAFQAIPTLVKTKATEAEAKKMITSFCWQRWPSELVSFATVGIGNANGDGTVESFFVRLLKEDESVAFDIDSTSVEDPLSALSKLDLIYLVEQYFIHSPFSFLLNDSLIIEALENGTMDPALLSIMIAFVLSSSPFIALAAAAPKSNKGTRKSSSTPSSQPSSKILALTPAPFISFAERSIFATTIESAALTSSNTQSLFIYGMLLLSERKARASWAAMATGLSVVRESLKRIKNRDQNVGRTEEEEVEEEQLINLWWLFGIFPSWCFISMRVPRAIIHESAEALPLPPFTAESSLSFAYRSRNSKFDSATNSITNSIRSHNETSRILSLIITLSIQAGPKAAVMSKVVNSKLAGVDGEGRAFEFPFVADSRIAGLEIWSLFVGKWLLDMAQQHSSKPSQDSTNSFSQRKIRNSPFLSSVHAIMCLHRLAPFNEWQGNLELSAPGLRLALRSMQILVSESAQEVEDSIRSGEDAAGRIDAAQAKTGLMRLIGDCLPHCLRIMDYLVEKAKTSAEIFDLLSEQKTEISNLLADLIYLGDCGLQVPVPSIIEESEKRSRAATREEPKEFIKRARSTTTGTSNIAPALERSYSAIPATTKMFENESDQMETDSTSNNTLPLPYPYCFDSQLAPYFVGVDSEARARSLRASSFSGRQKKGSVNQVRSLSHHISMDQLERNYAQLPSPTPSIQRMTSYSSTEYYSPLSNATPLPSSPEFLSSFSDYDTTIPSQHTYSTESGIYSNRSLSPSHYSTTAMDTSDSDLYRPSEDLSYRTTESNLPALSPRYFDSDLAAFNGPFGSTQLFFEHTPLATPVVDQTYSYT